MRIGHSQPGGGLGTTSADRLAFGLLGAAPAVPFSGTEFPHGEMDFADYETLGVWRIERVEWGDTLQLRLIESRARADVTLPGETWERSEFPNMFGDQEGLPKAIAYGEVFRVPCVCVDTTTNEFRAVGHEIAAFRGFYNPSGSIEVTSATLSTKSIQRAPPVSLTAWTSSASPNSLAKRLESALLSSLVR